MDYVEDNTTLDMTEEGIVSKVRKDVKDWRTHTIKWRSKAKLAYDMYAGVQWTADEVFKLEQQGRPPITFNRITKIINLATGLELQNRQDINCIPFGVTPNQTGVSDLAGSAMKWVRNETEAEDEESEAYEDVLICGLGFVYTYVDYEIDQDGKIVEGRIDPFLAGFDKTARKKNAEDSKFRFITIKYTKNDFFAAYPDAKDLYAGGSTLFDEVEASVENDKKDYENNTEPNLDKGMIEVIYYQCYSLVPVYRVENQILDEQGQPTGQTKIDTLEADQYELIKDQLEALGLKAVKQMKRKYHQYIVAGNALLQNKDAPIDAFSIKVMTGLRDRNTNTWFGLVQLMLDPQRWANKWLSQLMHILNSNAKGGYLYETGAFKDPVAAEENMARPDKNVEVNPGGLAKIQPKPQPNYPEGIDRLMNYAMSAIPDTAGVPQELMGMTDHNQPGVVEQSRKNAGITVLAQFPNTLRKFRKEQGRALLMFIQNYISDGRMIRIDEKNSVKYLPLFKDKMAVKYDIMIDDAPTSTNMKEKIFGNIMQLLPLAIQANVPVPPDLLDYTPLPQNLIDDWKAYITDQQKMTPEKQINNQLDMQMKDGQAKKLNSDADLNRAKVADILNKANITNQTSQSDAHNNLVNFGLEKIKSQSSQVKALAEIHKANTASDIAKVNLASTLVKAHSQTNSQPTNQG